jgi:hypothetical protein
MNSITNLISLRDELKTNPKVREQLLIDPVKIMKDRNLFTHESSSENYFSTNHPGFDMRACWVTCGVSCTHTA